MSTVHISGYLDARRITAETVEEDLKPQGVRWLAGGDVEGRDERRRTPVRLPGRTVTPSVSP